MSELVAYSAPNRDLFEGYIRYKRALGYAAGEDYQYLARDVFGTLARREPDPNVVGRAAMEEIVSRRPHESARTNHMRISMLRQICLWLATMGYEPCTPPLDLMPRVPGFTPRIVTEGEMAGIIRVADADEAPWVGLTLRILWCCGARLGEVRRLTVSDVDLGEGLLLVRHAKGNKTRILPMSASLWEFVRGYMELHRPEWADGDTPIMPTKNGTVRPSCHCWKVLHRVYEKAGVLTREGKAIRTHDLRHSFAVHALARLSDAGMDARAALPLLASYMGHADIKSTEYYLHFTREAMLRIVDAQAEDSEAVFGGVI